MKNKTNRVVIGPRKRIAIDPDPQEVLHKPRVLVRMINRQILQPARKTVLPPKPTTLKEELREKGWKREKKGFRGRLKGNVNSYEGFIVQIDNTHYDIWIKNPSKKVRAGFGGCIHRPIGSQPGWWRINFRKGKDNPLGEYTKVQDVIRGVGE